MNAIFGILNMNENSFYNELMIFRELRFFLFQEGYDT